jgi:hypothetical protein
MKTGCGDLTARRYTEHVKSFMFWSFCIVLGRSVKFRIPHPETVWLSNSGD